jgi:hypothetical protein
MSGMSKSCPCNEARLATQAGVCVVDEEKMSACLAAECFRGAYLDLPGASLFGLG